MNRTPMIPTLIESARTGLLTFLFAAAFFVIVFAIAAWDFLRATWDTLVLGKTEAEQLRDYLGND
jgi:hypothetical protein